MCISWQFKLLLQPLGIATYKLTLAHFTVVRTTAKTAAKRNMLLAVVVLAVTKTHHIMNPGSSIHDHFKTGNANDFAAVKIAMKSFKNRSKIHVLL